jgi:hypothetical protein
MAKQELLMYDNVRNEEAVTVGVTASQKYFHFIRRIKDG